MRFAGTINSAGKDYATGKYMLDIRTDENAEKIFDSFNGHEVEIEVKRRSEKRSLDANAYYWVIVTKISEKLNVSKPYLHNLMLRRYGQIALLDDKAVYVVIPDTEKAELQTLEAETYHLKPTSQVKCGRDGMTYRTYMMLRGSSDYNTAEMSILIDGAVSEAKELGIETLPPDKIKEMMAAYEKHYAARSG